MPQFSGDVREYITFRSDFRHIVESRYGKRDAVALLRTSLNGKPLELIRGIGKDYDTAWDYLDSIYGDPRYVAVTQDLTRFRPLREGEDARFCELVHLVRRSFNTLKEVGRPHDMDNNHPCLSRGCASTIGKYGRATLNENVSKIHWRI